MYPPRSRILWMLAWMMLGILPADLTRAQPDFSCPVGITCPLGTFCAPHPVCKPCLRCIANPPPPTSVVVDWQNSGFADGTAARPFQTIEAALDVVAAGGEIGIRTGSYAIDGVLSKSVSLGTENGPVTIKRAPVWVDTQTRQPAIDPAPFNLVARYFDLNGIPSEFQCLGRKRDHHHSSQILHCAVEVIRGNPLARPRRPRSMKPPAVAPAAEYQAMRIGARPRTRVEYIGKITATTLKMMSIASPYIGMTSLG